MVTVVFVQVVLCNEPAEMFDYISEDQITTDVGGQLEFDANEWTQHKSVCISTLPTCYYRTQFKFYIFNTIF